MMYISHTYLKLIRVVSFLYTFNKFENTYALNQNLFEFVQMINIPNEERNDLQRDKYLFVHYD